jgi:hypothetical protein
MGVGSMTEQELRAFEVMVERFWQIAQTAPRVDIVVDRYGQEKRYDGDWLKALPQVVEELRRLRERAG